MGALRGGAAAAAAALRRATRARPPRIAPLGPTAAAARARGVEARAGAPQRRAAVAAVGAGAGVPEPKRYSISAEGVRGQTASTTDTGHVLRTDLPKAMGGSDAAAQPVETLLAALIGCEQATAAFVARHMQPRMDLLKIEFNYYAERDNRGAVALPLDEEPPVAARLTRVWGTAAVDVRGDEPPERIDELHRLVSQRCPIANMFAAAGVDMDGVVWAARES
eukprot:PRCOL_00005951-RA